MKGYNNPTKYDPTAFKKLHARHMRGMTYTIDGVIENRRGLYKEWNSLSSEPLMNLTMAIILQAASDYRRWRRKNRKTIDTDLFYIKQAAELGFSSPLDEVESYFRGEEFLHHCALCGFDPEKLKKRLGVLV